MRIVRLLAVVIVAATAAFAVGVSIEKSENEEPAEASAEAAHAESGEGGSVEGEHTEAAGVHDEAFEEGEELLGIDPESTPLVVLAVIGSLALALAVWARPDVRWLLPVVGFAMLAFAALDIREVFHQVDESNEGLAVLVGVVAVLLMA